MGDEVTTILNRFRGFLGTGSPVAAPTPSTTPAVSQDRLTVPGTGTGTIANVTTINRTAQAQVAGTFSKVDPSLVPVVDKSITDNTTARRAIDQIGTTYDGRSTSLKPVSNTVTGQVALTQAKIEAVGDGAANTRGSVQNAQLRAALVEALARRIAAQNQSQAQAGGAQSGSGGGSGSGAGSGASGAASGAGSALTSATKPLDSGQAAKIATILALASKGKGGSKNTDESSSDTGTATTVAAGDTAGASAQARKAIAFAMAQRGDPYGWGANGPNSWDCSSLVKGAAAAAGVSVPRTTYDLAHTGQAVSGALKPGDIILGNYQGGRPEHVQMYIGGGKVIHAPQTGDVVRVADYNPSGTRARRIF